MKMPRAAAIIVAGLLGLACSNSSLKRSAGDAGAERGGQAGSTVSGGTTGGSGGTIRPDAAGGVSTGGTGGTIGSGGSNGGGGIAGSFGTGGTGGQGGTAGSPPSQGGRTGSSPWCTSIMMCDNAQQVDGPCPAERECYSFQQYCFDATTVCMLPEGVHCRDLSCNTGDTPTTSDDEDCRQQPNACYTKQLCKRSIWCRYGADGVDSGVADTGTDARTIRPCGNGVLDPGEECDDGNTNNGDGCNAICQIEAGWQCPTPGQACVPCGTDIANGCDAGAIGYCGDGIIQTNLGEECDFGSLNGVQLDANGNPTDAGGCHSCSTGCKVPSCFL